MCEQGAAAAPGQGKQEMRRTALMAAGLPTTPTLPPVTNPVYPSLRGLENTPATHEGAPPPYTGREGTHKHPHTQTLSPNNPFLVQMPTLVVQRGQLTGNWVEDEHPSTPLRFR